MSIFPSQILSRPKVTTNKILDAEVRDEARFDHQRIGRGYLNNFYAAVAALFICGTPASASDWTYLHDYEVYTKGNYLAYAGAWNPGSLKEGTDYSDTIRLDQSSFSNTTLIKWGWPEVPAQGVYGFNQLGFGDYDGGNPQTPIPSKRISDITQLKAEHAIRLYGELPNFTSIYDLFLTDSPKGNILYEIEVFLHTPPAAQYFVTHSTQIGTYTTKYTKKNWTVAMSNNDILFMPADELDVPRGSIDMKAIFNYLISKKILTGSEYFNGLALGAEPIQGTGKMNVKAFHVYYQ